MPSDPHTSASRSRERGVMQMPPSQTRHEDRESWPAECVGDGAGAQYLLPGGLSDGDSVSAPDKHSLGILLCVPHCPYDSTRAQGWGEDELAGKSICFLRRLEEAAGSLGGEGAPSEIRTLAQPEASTCGCGRVSCSLRPLTSCVTHQGCRSPGYGASTAIWSTCLPSATPRCPGRR